MKPANKKLIVSAVVFVLTVMLVFAMPTAVFAESTAIRPIAFSVTAGDVNIDAADAELDEKPIYALELVANGGSGFSSFELRFRMPDFTKVTAITPSGVLENNTNAVFTWYADEATDVVTVAYSSGDNVSSLPLFMVSFTVDSYETQYGAVEYVDSTFVNTDNTELEANVMLGKIEIGKADFAQMGDVDGNGTVDLADLLIIQRSMVNPNYTLTEAQHEVADINCDGAVNVFDCQYIQNYLVGRIDSLENIGGSQTKTYTLWLNIMSTSNDAIWINPYTAEEGRTYKDVLESVFEELSQTYSEIELVHISSSYYGDIEGDALNEDYVAKTDDTLLIRVEVEKKTNVVYTFEDTYPNSDGTTVTLSYTFYDDGTVLGKMTSGENVMEQKLTWKQVGSYIDVYMEDGSAERMFTVSADGTLSPYDDSQGGESTEKMYTVSITVRDTDGNTLFSGDRQAAQGALYESFMTPIFRNLSKEYNITGNVSISSDVYGDVPADSTGEGYVVKGDDTLVMVVSVVKQEKPDGPDYVSEISMDFYTIGLTVNDDMSDLLARLVGKTMKVTFQQSGTKTVIITEDMIRVYEDIGFGQVGEYSVDVMYEYECGSASHYVRVYILPDMSKETVLATYTCPDMLPEMELSTITIYQNGMLMVQDYYLAPSYVTLKDGVIAFDFQGGDIVLALDDASKTAAFYMPEKTEEVIGVYTYTVVYDGYVMGVVTYTVYGTYTGAGNYVAVMTQESVMAGESMTVTTRVYLDKENRKLDHAMGCNMTFDEKGNIQENHNEQTTTQQATCTQPGYTNVICLDCNMLVSQTYTAPLGHSYGDDDVCDRCGQGSGGSIGFDFEAKRQSALAYMKQEWESLQKEYGSDVLAQYEEPYSKYYTVVSTTESEIDLVECMNYFNNMVQNIRGGQGGTDNAEVLGTYRVTVGTLGYSTVTVYSNGMLGLDGMMVSCEVVYEDDGVRVVAFYNGEYWGETVLALDKAVNTADWHKPFDSMIGEYTYTEGDNLYIYKVYGSYNGPYNYVTVLTRKLGDGTGAIKQEDTYVTRVYLDLSSNTLSHQLFGMMSFDESGELFSNNYKPPVEPEYSFEQWRDQMYNEIKMQWSEFESPNSAYTLTQEQHEQGSSILERIGAAQYEYEVYELCEEFEELCNVIKGIREVKWYSTEGLAHRFVAGITMDDFLRMLNNVKLTVHFTDGTEQTFQMSADMFGYSELNLSKVGQYRLSWSFAEGEVSANGITHIEVIEDLGAGAELIGSYEYVVKTEGAINCMEWTSITLYNNGYAKLCDDYGVEFVKYTKNGNVVSYEYYDSTFLFEILTDGAGITMYVPEGDGTTYTYVDEDMGISITVYGEGSDRIGVMVLCEFNNDGTQDIYEATANVYFNEVNGKFFCILLEEWCAYDEAGNLTFVECEHTYVDGSCKWCGRDESNGSFSDIVVDSGVVESGSETLVGKTETIKLNSNL